MDPINFLLLFLLHRSTNEQTVSIRTWIKVEPGAMAVVRFYAKNDAAPEGTLGGKPYFRGAAALLLGITIDGQEEVVLSETAVPHTAGVFRRSVLIARVPGNVNALSLRFGMPYAWGKTLEVDWVH